jgi:GT2 family glycosyltransferase
MSIDVAAHHGSMEQAGHEGIKVSAIVVTYNGLRWVDRCLGSLRNSSWPVRTIVVDNGSIDGTPEHIARHFPEVELIRAERNLGFGQANNRGMRIALDRGDDHVFLLNQDAWVRPDTIGCLVERATAEPGYGVLSPLHVNGAGDALDAAFADYIVPSKCPHLVSDMALQRVQDRAYPIRFVNAAAWLITRHCLEVVGGFSPAFHHYGEDDEYLARTRFHDLGVAIVPVVRIHHDRAERPASAHFADRALQVRRTKLRYADPARSLDPGAERTMLAKERLRALISLERARYAAATEKRAVLQECELGAIVALRQRTRTPGRTFLTPPDLPDL